MDKSVAQAILEGASSTLTIYAGNGGAIESENGVWYVSYLTDPGDGGDDEVMTWALTSIDPPSAGAIRSVDGYAQNFSDWPVLEGANQSEVHKRSKTCVDTG